MSINCGLKRSQTPYKILYGLKDILKLLRNSSYKTTRFTENFNNFQKGTFRYLLEPRRLKNYCCTKI